MPSFKPDHNAPNLLVNLRKVLFNGHRALLMDRNDWEKAIMGRSGEFLIDPAITPMSKVQKNCKVVGCIAKNLGSNEYSLEIYRMDHNDKKPVNKDKYIIHAALDKREDFQELIPHSSTDYDNNMKSFLNETVIIEIKPKSEGHHLTENELPDLIKWKLIA